MSNDIKNIASIKEAEAMIAQEEENKRAVYLEIGKQYYLRHSADCEPDFKPLVDELVASSGRIAEINRRLLALKGLSCPKCGAPVNEDSIFCSCCGVRLKEDPVVEAPTVSPDVVICLSCGSEMKKDMRFCTVCGAPIAFRDDSQDASASKEFAPEDQGTAVPPADDTAEIPILDPASADEQIFEHDPQPEPDAPRRTYAAPEPANICPSCGAVSEAGMRFCVNCGNPLSIDTTPALGQDNGVRRCPRCGFISADPNMPFCIKCGSILS